MFDAIKSFFTSEHDVLLQNRSDLTATFKEKDTDFASQLARLEADDAYQSVIRAERVKEQIAVLKNKRDLFRADNNIKRSSINNQLRDAANPKINDFIRWCHDEKTCTQKALSIRGVVEQVSGFATGFLDTNEAKISARVQALDDAIKAAEPLRYGPQDSVVAEIEKLRATIPYLDGTTERIECGPGIAAGLQYPRVS